MPTQKELIMKNLGLTESEAEELLETDKAIDRGETMPFDLNADKLKISKEFSKTGTKTRKAPTVYKFEKKKVENAPKAEIISKVAEMLINEGLIDVQIVNGERLISFSNGDNNFEITLTQKRKPK
jgi:antitoxin component of RelBE/YafQ-DinJ toxin-antitoxin module